jgi:two-component system response regulator TctD
LRAQVCAIPILMIGPSMPLQLRIDALDAGADDFLGFPFIAAELAARIRAIARRAHGPRWVSLGKIPVKVEDGIVELDGVRVQLSPREQELLLCLLRVRGDVVTREEILFDAFGYDIDPGTNIVDIHMGHLRKKLAGSSIAIETVRGAGFRVVDLGDGDLANDKPGR